MISLRQLAAWAWASGHTGGNSSSVSTTKPTEWGAGRRLQERAAFVEATHTLPDEEDTPEVLAYSLDGGLTLDDGEGWIRAENRDSWNGGGLR